MNALGADTGKSREVGAVRCHDLRTQAPWFSASARQSTWNPEKRGNALVDWRGERAPHNDPHKLTKPPSVGSAAEPPSGGSELHCVMAAAQRSLRIPRQSRQPPFRPEAGMVGGFAA